MSMKSEPDDLQLQAARERMRQYQRNSWIKRYGPLPPGEEEKGRLDRSLQALRSIGQVMPTPDPDTVMRGVFKFNRRQEEERLRLAEELIRRVDPGPYEDPNYLALLAFQAASIEMCLRSLSGGRTSEPWSRFLLGTVHSADVNAFAQVLQAEQHVLVVIYSAFVEFVYQASKALTAAQNPARSSEPNATVVSNTGTADIEEFLRTNPEPAQRLYKTLEAYFFEGYPRAFANETVKEEHHPGLSVMVGLAERWAIAHEYGHGLAAGVKFHDSPLQNPQWANELAADQQATILTVLSTASLDHMPPESALAAGIFALACLDVLHRAVAVLSGEEYQDTGDQTHPPYKLRSERVVETFYQFFEPVYDGPHLRDLKFNLERDHRPVVSERTREQIGHAFDFANGLFTLWKPVRELLQQDYLSKRPLHSMWLSSAQTQRE